MKLKEWQDNNMLKFDEVFEDLYNVRTIVLTETAPQSNKYAQVMFTEEQFKAFSQHTAELLGSSEYKPDFIVVTRDETHLLPDDTKVWYSTEEINDITDDE